MIPISDTAPRTRVPFVNWLIIAVNVAIFIFQLSVPNPQLFVNEYGFVPATLSPADPGTWIQVFTSFWLHGGLLHIASNMWFLHIFGDNIEDQFGHLSYLAFYIVAGIAAGVIQYLVNATSVIPMIGASGAVAGVLGAYFVFFRDHEIRSLLFTPFGFFTTVKISSVFFIGYWFILQLFSGIGSLQDVVADRGGVAYFAHIGGFVFGLVLGKQFQAIKYRPEGTELES